MARRCYLVSLVTSLLIGCQPSSPAEQVATPPPVLDSVQLAIIPAPTAPDTVDWLNRSLPGKATTDTTFRLNGQLYRLRLSATTDSARMLRIATDGIVGEALAADSNFARNRLVTGPAGRYQIVLTMAAGQPIMRKEFQKPDFYPVVGADIVVVSEPIPPRFLGYYPEVGGLAFWQEIGIPGSDVGTYVFYLLDLQGRVRELSAGNEFGEGRADCDPLPAPRGGALLTCGQLLRAGQPPLPLQKPHADLVLARFLSDTTVLTIYQYGEYKVTTDSLGHPESMEWQVPPRLRNQPNAFVLNLRGQPVARFRYTGFASALGYTVPRAYLPATRTYYLLDEEQRALRLLEQASPAATREVKFGQMSPFRPPRKPAEARLVLDAEASRYEFYVDKSQPSRIRYRRRPLPG
ncbi:hypothetical protein MUN84_01870 [Hymenobacter sp. 5516J-16]|uniref:hypothetical protein n=1 Tax=Hymenobacter sp. 5516J-16 TaxID=2932253 RepID=UPI001FD57993|nr:hypothetical protein [Hymenobacter sp. 5516J-16]UOQ77481.1 hypothetical protein MUN84_01870 [Hymenobacter sp. 5516J-16]